MALNACKYSPDQFCYVCGEFLRKNIKIYSLVSANHLCDVYKAYFKIEVANQDKPWVPHFSCQRCVVTLNGWYHGKNHKMKFGIPRIWKEPTSHSGDCFFCMVEIHPGKNKSANKYPNIPSSKATVPHSLALPVPQRGNPEPMEEDILLSPPSDEVPDSVSIATSLPLELRSCKHSPDSFCYICGEFIPLKARKYSLKSSDQLRSAYTAYFKIEIEDQDKPWVPNFSCQCCSVNLNGWFRGENRKMKFAYPRIWREPSNHATDCFFCMVELSSAKNTLVREIIDLPSSRAPVPHSSFLAVPKRTFHEDMEEGESLESMRTETVVSVVSLNYRAARIGGLRNPHYPDQKELNDLVRDLTLTKSNAELLSSRLKQWDLLDDSVKITEHRQRHQLFSKFYTYEDGLCYCHDIKGLFEMIGIPCCPSEWRLFLDGSSKSLKVVLLHNWTDKNQYPSLPMAHSVHLKENYNSTKMILEALKYKEYGWEVIADFKMVAFLMGLQGGFTKYPCFICLWDSRDTKSHYQKRHWEERVDYVEGKHNVKWEPLLEPSKILMPPLHIKLGLIKQFVKALNKESEAFKLLQQTFPKLSEAKVKAGVFTGPQIKKIINCSEFPLKLNVKEHAAWNSFVNVVRCFLGNNRVKNYVELVEGLVKNYEAMGCRMSLKLHILDAHLEKFKDNMGKYSEEQGERFHQDMMHFEQRYQGQYRENMMGDYIWTLIRECNEDYNRKPRSSNHFTA